MLVKWEFAPPLLGFTQNLVNPLGCDRSPVIGLNTVTKTCVN